MASTSLYVEGDLDLINRLQQLFTLARNAKRNLYDSWMRNYKLVNNRVGGNVGGSSWYPAPRDSEIYPTLSAIAAWMTDQNVTLDVVAAADPHSPYSNFMQQIAQDLSTVMQTNWIVDSYEAQVRMAVWDSFQTGAGFFKNVWDQSLAGNLGNAKLIRVDPWAFYVDPNATSLEDAEFMVEVRRMSLDEIERRWPNSSPSLEMQTGLYAGGVDSKPDQYDMNSNRAPKANPGALPQGNARWSAPNSRGPDGGAMITPGIIVYEYWVKENDEYWASELVEEGADKGLTMAESEKPPEKKKEDDEKHVAVRWRVIVVAGNQILMDEYANDLYSFGTHPYERFVFEETGELYGVALCDHLAQPQIYLNRLLTALQHNAELIGNPIFLENANSGLDRVNVINKPGQRLRLNGPAGLQQNRPEWLRPPEMPAYIQDLVQFWISRIENISGLSAAVKGGTSGASRTPEGVISTIQESAFVRIRAALSNMEDTLNRCAYKLADLIIDNYTEPRMIAIVGPQGGPTSMALASKHFVVPTRKGATPLKYSLMIQAGASAPTTRQARAAEADQAYALGIIDRQGWFEAHGTPNWPQMLTRINQSIADGSFQPPGARQRSH